MSSYSQVKNGLMAKTGAPLDGMLEPVNDLEALKAIDSDYCYPGMQIWVKLQNCYYTYNPENEESVESGKWRKFEGGGTLTFFVDSLPEDEDRTPNSYYYLALVSRGNFYKFTNDDEDLYIKALTASDSMDVYKYNVAGTQLEIQEDKGRVYLDGGDYKLEFDDVVYDANGTVSDALYIDGKYKQYFCDSEKNVKYIGILTPLETLTKEEIIALINGTEPDKDWTREMTEDPRNLAMGSFDNTYNNKVVKSVSGWFVDVKFNYDPELTDADVRKTMIYLPFTLPKPCQFIGYSFEGTGNIYSQSMRHDFYDSDGDKYIDPAQFTTKKILVNSCVLDANGHATQKTNSEGQLLFDASGIPLLNQEQIEIDATETKQVFVLSFEGGRPKKVSDGIYGVDTIDAITDPTFLYKKALENAGCQVDNQGRSVTRVFTESIDSEKTRYLEPTSGDVVETLSTGNGSAYNGWVMVEGDMVKQIQSTKPNAYGTISSTIIKGYF